MKTIKQIAAFAAMLGILASCQEQGLESPETGQELVPVTLSASFSEIDTKVSYIEEDNGSNYLLKPVWEKDTDSVIGFDGDGNKYTFIVSDVDASGVATLSGDAPASCTLHLIYLCGATAESITGNSMTVSYASQSGDKTMPAVMLADGTVAYGTGSFEFHNAGAVIGIKAVNGVPNGSTISKITVSGENLSAASICLNGSSLKLTATEKSGDSISITPGGLTVTNDNGTLSSIDPILIAVPAGAVVNKVSATTTDKGTFDFTLASPSTLAANQYSYVKNQKFKDPYNGHQYVEIAAKYDGTNVTTLKWATCNVGADSPQESGWYFFWAGTVGYEYDSANSKWVTAESGAELSDGFKKVNAPYYLRTDSNDNILFSKYIGTLSPPYRDPLVLSDADALKTVLDQEDDAAHVNWGGSWRMPKYQEFGAMADVTYWAWDDTDKGFYVFSPDDTHTAGTWVSNIPGDLSKTSALLFFPATGYGSTYRLREVGVAQYWSSCVDVAGPYYAECLNISSSYRITGGGQYRSFGNPVRPVSD